MAAMGNSGVSGVEASDQSSQVDAQAQAAAGWGAAFGIGKH